MSGYESDTCGRSYTIRIRYVWTQIFLYAHKKNLRIQKSPDTCGRGLTCIFSCLGFIGAVVIQLTFCECIKANQEPEYLPGLMFYHNIT